MTIKANDLHYAINNLVEELGKLQSIINETHANHALHLLDTDLIRSTMNILAMQLQALSDDCSHIEE